MGKKNIRARLQARQEENERIELKQVVERRIYKKLCIYRESFKL